MLVETVVMDIRTVITQETLISPTSIPKVMIWVVWLGYSDQESHRCTEDPRH